MGAEITSGYNEPCDEPGGVDVIWAFALRDANGVKLINSYTVNEVTGTVTDLTLVNGQKSFAFNIEQGTANFNVNSIGDKQSGSNAYTHTSTMVLHGNTGETLVNIHALNIGRHALIHKLADGSYELLHMENGAKNQSNRDSGTAYADMNGTTLTLTSDEKLYAPKIPESIVTSLLIPNS